MVMNDTQMDRDRDKPHQWHNFGLKSGKTKLDVEGARIEMPEASRKVENRETDNLPQPTRGSVLSGGVS